MTEIIYMADPQSDRHSEKANDYSRWRRLLKTAVSSCGAEGGAPLVVLGGDLVNRGARRDEWEAFYEAGSGILDRLPVIAASGNCDRNRFEEVAARFSLPLDGPFGHDHSFYSYDYGCCHMIVLDSNLMGTLRSEAVDYLQAWIRKDLGENKMPVTIAVIHHPLLTAGTSFDDDMRAAVMKQNYLPLLDEGGVDLILCGHQHLYARSRKLCKRSSDKEPDPGITQIMSVSGGKLFEPYDISHFECVKTLTPVAVIVRSDGDDLYVRAIDPEGNVLDESKLSVRISNMTPAEQLAGAEIQRDPFALLPERIGGITVRKMDGSECCYPKEQLDHMSKKTVAYSARTYRFFNVEMTGILLEKLIGNVSGILKPALHVISAEGWDSCLPLSEVMDGKRFESLDSTSGEPVPAMICMDNDQLRLVFGQQSPKEYNWSKWLRNVAELEVVSGDILDDPGK